VTTDQTDRPGQSRAIYALCLLMLASFFSFLDRQILTLLVPPIKADLGITDTQISLLQGFSFALFFSVMAIPFGWAVDRYNRKNLVAIGIATWSLATVYSGLSNSFTELLIARVLVGVGEATLMPAAYSILADYFPPHQRGRAFGVFMMSVFLGGGGALLFGGMILHALAGLETVVLPLVGATSLWKAAFIVVGAPGLLVAVAMLTVKEPRRGGYGAQAANATAAAAAGARTLVSYIKEHPRAFFCVWSVYSLLACISYSVTPWAVTLLVRKFDTALPTAGLAIGAASLVGGLIGANISGFLGDRWTVRGAAGGKFRLTLVFWLCILPAVMAFALSGTFNMAVAGYFLFVLVNTVGYVSASAVIQDMVPSHLRGRTTAFWYLVTGILGNGFGPMATALVTDHVFRNEAALPYSMVVVAIPGVILGLTASLLGIKAYDEARRRLVA
jgi:MFS family permease